ncbi:MAG: hypothetical protein ABR577_16880 [Pyrinomonadaceae bacterium]
MSARAMTATGNRRKRRWTSFAWIAACAAVIIALLVWEQVALLYVLGTLAVTVLLIVVALADLDGTRSPAAAEVAPYPADDSAALGDNLSGRSASPAMTSAAKSSSGSRARNAKRR